MRFEPTPIAGAFLVEVDRIDDERGGFARTYCADEFRRHGLDPTVAQESMSWNLRRGTLRGLHYQASHHAEAKTVRVMAGAVFDVVVDLRASSPTYGRWFGAELSQENHRALHLPLGCAHGFITLRDETVLHYQISVEFRPEAARGVRWDDPTLAIAWPLAPTCISARDRALPLLGHAD